MVVLAVEGGASWSLGLCRELGAPTELAIGANAHARLDYVSRLQPGRRMRYVPR